VDITTEDDPVEKGEVIEQCDGGGDSVRGEGRMQMMTGWTTTTRTRFFRSRMSRCLVCVVYLKKKINFYFSLGPTRAGKRRQRTEDRLEVKKGACRMNTYCSSTAAI